MNQRIFSCGMVLACLPVMLQGQQGRLETVAVAALRDAPGFPDASGYVRDMGSWGQAFPAASCSISGSVLDINGGLVPGATVTLTTEGSGAQPPREMTSDASGLFRFEELLPGRYKITIAAPGLKTFLSDEIVLRAGEHYQLPRVDLSVAATTADVQVTVTEREIAEEQIKQEEKQRVLGILPNFYSSYIWNAAPLSTRQKFGLAAKSITDPVAFLVTGVAAGVQQANNTYPGYGQEAGGYGKRYGANYADEATARMLNSAIYPTLFHQDPRYFYLGSGSVKSRSVYALTRSLICRGDNGKWQPNYSRLLGSLTAGAIANSYRTTGDRGVQLTIDNFLLNIAGNAFDNLIREFLLRRLTPKVPDYATGKPERETVKP